MLDKLSRYLLINIRDSYGNKYVSSEVGGSYDGSASVIFYSSLFNFRIYLIDGPWADLFAIGISNILNRLLRPFLSPMQWRLEEYI